MVISGNPKIKLIADRLLYLLFFLSFDFLKCSVVNAPLHSPIDSLLPLSTLTAMSLPTKTSLILKCFFHIVKMLITRCIHL